ncbi:hypothetical protein D3C76_1597860 [compost metagenome]
MAGGGEPRLQQVAHHQGPGIDEGVAGNALLKFELHQRVERLARGLLADPGPDLILLIEGQCQGEAQGLGDALDGEGFEGVTGGEQLPLHGTDRDAEPIGGNLGQRGDIVGHLALSQQGTNLLENAGQ